MNSLCKDLCLARVDPPSIFAAAVSKHVTHRERLRLSLCTKISVHEANISGDHLLVNAHS